MSFSQTVITRLGIITVYVWSICFPVVSIAQDTTPADQKPEFKFEAFLTEAGTMPRLYSILVSRKGEVILERYFNGSGPARLVDVKSVSKSVISALVGIAIEKGHIKNIDQPIGDYFKEKLSSEADAPKRSITIEDLLTMQSGLESTSNRNYGAWVLSPDWISYALRQPLELPPGTSMRYSTGNIHLLSAILTQTTGMDTLQFARKSLAEPLGFHLAAWPKDPQGIYFGGNDMEFTARQMLAFGELYLNEGRANGKQIIPAAWVKASLQHHTESPRELGRYYGYAWWIRYMAGFETPYAWGYGGQFIFLVPQLDLVVVTTSMSTPDDERRGHRREIQDLVEEGIIRVIADTLHEIPANHELWLTD